MSLYRTMQSTKGWSLRGRGLWATAGSRSPKTAEPFSPFSPLFPRRGRRGESTRNGSEATHRINKPACLAPHLSMGPNGPEPITCGAKRPPSGTGLAVGMPARCWRDNRPVPTALGIGGMPEGQSPYSATERLASPGKPGRP